MADICPQCGHPQPQHNDAPSEVGSCVPRVPGMWEPVHAKLYQCAFCFGFVHEHNRDAHRETCQPLPRGPR